MPSPRLSARLRGLPRRRVAGVEVPVAVGLRVRLLGLGRLGREEAGSGLMIPRCAAVHTIGMRFALDLTFLDRAGRPIERRHDVPSRRFAWCRGATAVLETPAREGGESRPDAT